MRLRERAFPALMAGQTLKQRVAGFVLAAITATGSISITDPAAAKKNTQSKQTEVANSGPRPVPLLAVVALSEQRVTIYDTNGKILQSPVSTGQKGYETPAGIYSVLQKNREHYSNVYEGASMPFMQRLTWSGIALHAGVLPGRPASHGCIRMPQGFAKELFELTKVGLRVAVVRDDMSPVEIAHPALPKPGPIRSMDALAVPHDQVSDKSAMQLAALMSDAATGRAHTWKSIATAKAAAATTAAQKAAEAKRAAGKAEAQAAGHARSLRLAEAARLSAEAQLKVAEHGLERVASPAAREKAETVKAKAEQRLLGAQERLDLVKTEGQAKIDAAIAAREEAKAAESAKLAAQSEAKMAQAKMAPVSVFISRKTQKLYVRQAFQPMFESPVAIRDPDTPIGTSIFTALDYINQDADVRWNVVSMYASDSKQSASDVESRRRGKTGSATATDIAMAKAVLDRITIPQDAIDRINESISPGSSLIISDELTSRETGKGTDFIVLMSGEPQGGIIIRRRKPGAGYRSLGSFRRPDTGASGNSFSWW